MFLNSERASRVPKIAQLIHDDLQLNTRVRHGVLCFQFKRITRTSSI